MFFSELAHYELSGFLSKKRETDASSDWAHSEQAQRQLLAVFELARSLLQLRKNGGQTTKSSSGNHFWCCQAREAAQVLLESTGGPGWWWRINPQPFSPVFTSNNACRWFGGPNDNKWNGVRLACTLLVVRESLMPLQRVPGVVWMVSEGRSLANWRDLSCFHEGLPCSVAKPVFGKSARSTEDKVNEWINSVITSCHVSTTEMWQL